MFSSLYQIHGAYSPAWLAAGLGRAPATALAYMYWCRGFTLRQAMDTFFAQRPCNPRIQSIRQATLDLLSEGSKLTPVKIAVSRPFLATKLQASH